MVQFNNSQRLGLDLDRHIALDAGAGTGKTTVMAERYVQHLIAHDQRATHVTPPGPRTPLTGLGALRAPQRERTGLDAWPGLLPAEVVAITFTKKAAAELKARIRVRLARTRAHAPSEGDSEGLFDPRLRSDADVEMLLSSLDEAPISTIDAFLHRLVQPYIDLVALYPAHDMVAEAQTPLMLNDALHTVWRIRSVEDAHEVGVLNHHRAFIEARNRLVTLLGGQQPAEVVLKGLMGRSLFVEQSHRSMIQRAERLGVSWSGRGPAPVALLLDLIAEPVVGDIVPFVQQLHGDLVAWTNLFLHHHPNCVMPAETDTHLTRFNHLVRMAQAPCPALPGDALTWSWTLMMALASNSGLSRRPTSFFPRNHLPNADEWPSGLLSKSKVKGLSKGEKDDLYEQAHALQHSLKDRLISPLGSLVQLLARAAFFLNPGDGLTGIPLSSPLRPEPLTHPLPEQPPSSGTYIDGSLQTEVLSDLIVVHRACHQILARRKSLDGLHDFDDLQRYAADLLLARCPDACRHLYPPEVIDVLDGLGDEPWGDSHITRALTMLNDQEPLRQDLHRRFLILGEIRRQYRAFIIDEYQDTNPSHFRLLARLWGRRTRQPDDPGQPQGDWDPTICIVGDMKQSIYRFRQAEVSVMRRAVAMIRTSNLFEQGDTRLQHLRQEGHGRDPRPVGAGGESGSFSNDHAVTSSAPHSFVRLDVEDGQTTPSITGERLLRREEGHVDLTSNHRTRANLMNSMNDVFDEVFDAVHHDLPGDWHAEPQRLRPARQTDEGGVLEWLLPIQGSLGDVSSNLDVPVNTFQDPYASKVHLEHELIAQRLASLVNGEATKVWNSSTASWAEVDETGPSVRPSDVMILVNSRRHLPDLVQRLRARGLPVMADRLGLLLTQPSVKPLQGLLTLMARPTSRLAAFTVARSPIVGMDEHETTVCLQEMGDNEEAWPHLIAHAPSVGVGMLLERLHRLVQRGSVYEVFDDVLDHSDLLVAHPDDAQRQFAEAWLGMIREIGAEHGHDVSTIHAQMATLRELDSAGPKAISPPSAEAIQIMTIHGSKGLQAPVVVVSGLFTAGMADASISVQDNVLVTPQVVAGRIQPWLAHERPQDGLWAFATEMNKAQDKAELRRKFYVALTRVKDRLILSGSPGDRSEWNLEGGDLAVNIKPDARTMGHMLIQGLRRAAWVAGSTEGFWLESDQIGNEVLSPYQPRREPVPFNPATLLTASPLGEEGVQGVRLYHHPDCFEHSSPPSPQHTIATLSQVLEQMEPVVPEPALALTSTSVTLKGAAHHLDTTLACPRRYWLEHIKGWPTEPFWLPGLPRPPKQQNGWPEATTFGLMMHRLLEIGLFNPRKPQPQSAPLSRAWMHEGHDRLTDEAALSEVMNEFGFGLEQPHGTDEAVWRSRLHHLATLVQRGRLGQYLAGAVVDGWTVEALRTEWPFFHRHPMEMDHRTDAPFLAPTHVTSVVMEFSGRADLVLALSNGEGPGALQVVDLKTTGCLSRFDESNSKRGHPLQAVHPEETDSRPLNDAETAMLSEHRLQLTLYSMALESMEAQRPPEHRRVVLPPAVLVGANGRMVALTQDQFDEARSLLETHLHWRAAMHLSEDPEGPNRLPLEADACGMCPFYRGHVRRCAPEGEPLGLGPFTSDP